MGKHWPHYLSSSLDLTLHNRAEQSAGNGWISRSVIFQTDQLLKSGIPAEEILVVAMWSGLDRKGFFISRNETPNFVELAIPNKEPRNFIDRTSVSAFHIGKNSGWLEGTNVRHYPAPETSSKLAYKDKAFEFFPLECLAIESYEHFLRLQWYCDANDITLVNLTYADILRYPNSSFINPRKKDKLTKDTFPNVTHLYNMLNFSKWLFYDETSGMYEYVYRNDLGFQSDGTHPTTSAHKKYVEDFIIPNLKERNVI
jgi:hypothetical protein